MTMGLIFIIPYYFFITDEVSPGAGDNLIASAVFGRSLSDWSRNYVRIGDHSEVYLTESTVLHLLSNRADHWAEAPKPKMSDMPMGQTIISAKRPDGTRIIDTLKVIEEK